MVSGRSARSRSTGRLIALAMLLPVAAIAAPVCIQTLSIDHTEIPNDSTILFHMRDGTTYRNDLPQRCPGLRIATNGFTYSPTSPASDELCDNLSSFRVNDGIGTGAVCLFGAFTKVK